MIRFVAILSLAALAACESNLVWSDFEYHPETSAVARNRAMMVQNPNDLVRARASSGRDANRSVDVLGKYGRGEATASASEAQGNTSTSASPMSGGK